MAFAGTSSVLLLGVNVRAPFVGWVAIIAMSSVPGLLLGQAPAPPSQIVASGVGEVRVTPDRATILVGVQSRASTAAAAAADNARRQRAILDTLRKLGLGNDQLSTINYHVSPEMQYLPNSQPRVTGYTVTNTVRADVQKLDDAARVIDAALAKGANEISSLRFFSSVADSARRAALEAAVKEARADAEALARAAGGTLGSLLELSTSQGPIMRGQEMMATAGMAAARVATPIEPGQQSISASVVARWAFVGR